MRIKSFFLALIFLFFFYLSNSSANSPLSIDSEVDKKTVTTGDIITYTITLKHALDVISSTPNFDTIDSFDIIEKITSPQRETGEGIIEQKYSVKLRADEIGTHTIPPIQVPFKIKKPKTTEYIPGEVRSKRITIEVASVLRLQGEPVDIKDIKNIVEVDKNWVPWFFWTLNFLLLVTVLYLLWKYRKIKHKNSTVVTPDIPTHLLAFRELDDLKSKGLLKHGNAREHFFQLSEIFRRYLGKRYLFPAPDWTTEEITGYFKNQEKIEITTQAEANRILKKSDMIKFAKAQAFPETDEIESVRNFIKLTHEKINLGLYPN